MTEPPASRLLPILVLAAILGVAVLGWWLFPTVQAMVSRQDCIATGRTNCG